MSTERVLDPARDAGRVDPVHPPRHRIEHLEGVLDQPLSKTDTHGHRSRSIEQTWSLVEPLLATIGVTRMADITGLDQVGIPVYQAVVPDSAEEISVYGGKGLSRAAARVSAAMEAFERYSALLPRQADHFCSLREAWERDLPVLDPRETNDAIHPDFGVDSRVGWIWGFELVGRSPILVTLEQATTAWHQPGEPVLSVNFTRGLASGNNLTEAVIHGLYEVVERDNWTFAMVVGQTLPKLLSSRADGAPPTEDWGVGILRPVADELLSPRIEEHLAQFRAAGIGVGLFLITTSLRVPTALALSYEDGPLSFSHVGLGTDADPEIAIGRAVTELAQSRAGDASGAREDLAAAGDDVPAWARSTQRSISTERWVASDRPIGADECGAYASGDITRDLRNTIARCLDAGLDRVIAVDLTPAGTPFAACRILVPGTETWADDHDRPGDRLTDAWNAALARAGEAR